MNRCVLYLVSNSQVIGCEDRLRNDLYCVGWSIKLYSILVYDIGNSESKLHVLLYL